MSNAIVTEEIGSSLIIRFNRPEMRSPLSRDVLAELSRLVQAADSRTDIDRLIFTGVGSVFASGADLREIADVDTEGAASFAREGQQLMMSISNMSVMTIAAINGICFGGALDLALSCKLRLASPDATFSHPGAGLGIITGWGGTQRLPRLVGEARALEMFFTARRITADEALQIGLVDRVVRDPLETAIRSDT